MMTKDFLESKSILVTGATGFVGACLVRRLIGHGSKPHVFIRKKSNLWRIKDVLDKLSVHYLDLNDYDQLKSEINNTKPDIVYHLATYGGYHYQKDYDQILKVNIMGTFNLLKACSKSNLELFVNTGTSSEYGIKSNSMKEIDLLDPVDIYGASKASSTLLCRSFARLYNLPLVNFRLFSPYGYYEDRHRFIPYVIMKCLKRENPELTPGEAVRDFNFIEDVLDVYIDIVGKNNLEPGEIFNIANGKQYSIREVVKNIIAILGEKVKPKWNVLKDRQNEPKTWVADICKAKEILDFNPKHDLKMGLKKTVEWFKTNINLYD